MNDLLLLVVLPLLQPAANPLVVQEGGHYRVYLSTFPAKEASVHGLVHCYKHDHKEFEKNFQKNSPYWAAQFKYPGLTCDLNFFFNYTSYDDPIRNKGYPYYLKVDHIHSNYTYFYPFEGKLTLKIDKRKIDIQLRRQYSPAPTFPIPPEDRVFEMTDQDGSTIFRTDEFPVRGGEKLRISFDYAVSYDTDSEIEVSLRNEGEAYQIPYADYIRFVTTLKPIGKYKFTHVSEIVKLDERAVLTYVYIAPKFPIKTYDFWIENLKVELYNEHDRP